MAHDNGQEWLICKNAAENIGHKLPSGLLDLDQECGLVFQLGGDGHGFVGVRGADGFDLIANAASLGQLGNHQRRTAAEPATRWPAAGRSSAVTCRWQRLNARPPTSPALARRDACRAC